MPKLSLIMLVVLEMANATASSARRSVPAEEIIAKVQNNQPVEYDNVTISGDLDLGRLNPATFRSEFSIVNCTVENASFDGVSFQKDVFFWGATFYNASFNKTTFFANSDFINASFHRANFVVQPSHVLSHSTARNFRRMSASRNPSSRKTPALTPPSSWGTPTSTTPASVTIHTSLTTSF